MRERVEASQAPLHPLSCPRCGCPESKIIKSERMDQKAEPQPLPGYRRTRRCDLCEKQFRTKEQLEEIDLQSSVWRIRDQAGDVAPDSIDEGTYEGLWTMHEARCKIDGRVVTFHTRNEMRTEDYPCLVVVTHRGIQVESKRLDT